jgi:adenylosuccinate synthase
MKTGKFNVVLDQAWGSSGKGKISTWLADHYNVTKVSSANFPNAGHSAVFENGTKFISKAIPTSAILKKVMGLGMECFLSPGSGLFPKQLIKEWDETGRPNIYVHSRASIVTNEHAAREREGKDSTKHVASTMQGSGTAISDKILRKPDVGLMDSFPNHVNFLNATDPDINKILEKNPEDIEKIKIIQPMEFRNIVHSMIEEGATLLHEGSQGYALSIDHGSHYPSCTSRNCTLQAAMDYMAIPPSMVGDVYLNLRTFPIRVGNVYEDGVQKGYSGDFYPDCEELTWSQIAKQSGMPESEAKILEERERTTVTKRVRRVSTFSWIGLKDAVRTNGATKICINFVQYLNWKDAGLKGGRKVFNDLSKESREFIEKVEEIANVPVVLIGTGALHKEVINLLDE